MTSASFSVTKTFSLAVLTILFMAPISTSAGCVNPDHVRYEPLRYNAKLYPGDYICSYVDVYVYYKFGVNDRGDLVLDYVDGPGEYVIAKGAEDAYAVIQGDGNLVLRGSANKVYWSSKTNGNHGASINVLSDGTARITSWNGVVIWTYRPPGCKEAPLQAGDSLNRGEYVCYDANFFGLDETGNFGWWSYFDGEKSARYEYVTSGNGHRVKMQYDGNLVVRDKDGRSLWSTGTSNHPYSAFYFDAKTIDGTGNYYERGARIVDTGGSILWIENGL